MCQAGDPEYQEKLLLKLTVSATLLPSRFGDASAMDDHQKQKQQWNGAPWSLDDKLFVLQRVEPEK